MCVILVMLVWGSVEVGSRWRILAHSLFREASTQQHTKSSVEDLRLSVACLRLLMHACCCTSSKAGMQGKAGLVNAGWGQRGVEARAEGATLRAAPPSPTRGKLKLQASCSEVPCVWVVWGIVVWRLLFTCLLVPTAVITSCALQGRRRFVCHSTDPPGA